MDSFVLDMRGIGKRFGETTVLDDVDFAVRPGEVHALVGENGAGKSTLMRIAAGIHAPDAGTMTFAGRPFAPRSPGDARAAGIAMVHQELSLAPDSSVAENLFGGREPRRFGFVAWKELYRRAAALTAEFCPAVDPRAPVASLALGYRQIVEILKALAADPRLIVFDEPTASLESHETELLLATLGRLKAKGVGVVYISHRMDEIFRSADRITVLRDGRRTATWNTADTTRSAVVVAMVGRQLAERCRPKLGRFDRPLLEVRDLGRRGCFERIGFTLHECEVLGLSGLVGAGRTELVRAIYGAEPADSGSILLDGRVLAIRSVTDAVGASIAYVPEDRKTQGLFLDRDVQDNLLCGNWRQCVRGALVRRPLVRRLAERCVERMRVAARGVEQRVGTLSGGNQQKVLLGRSLAASPRVLIVDEPTRGIDIGAKAEIHRLLVDYASSGRGVLVVSSEMPELIALCDRILVMCEGRLAGEVSGDCVTERDLIRLATGEPGR